MRKGQLVRSKRYGRAYVVEDVGPMGCNNYLWCKPADKVILYSSLLFWDEELVLIGNNYKAKS